MKTIKPAVATVGLVLAAAALGVSGSVVAAAPAQAANSSCAAGNTCVFEGAPSDGNNQMVANSTGNLSPGYVSVNGGFVWDHGNTSSVEVFTTFPDNSHAIICLVNGPDIEWDQYPGDHPTAYLLRAGERVDKWIWRSACNSAAYEDRTGYYL